MSTKVDEYGYIVVYYFLSKPIGSSFYIYFGFNIGETITQEFPDAVIGIYVDDNDMLRYIKNDKDIIKSIGDISLDDATSYPFPDSRDPHEILEVGIPLSFIISKTDHKQCLIDFYGKAFDGIERSGLIAMVKEVLATRIC